MSSVKLLQKTENWQAVLLSDHNVCIFYSSFIWDGDIILGILVDYLFLLLLLLLFFLSNLVTGTCLFCSSQICHGMPSRIVAVKVNSSF